MTKDEKIEVVRALADKMREYPNFYVTDTGGMSVEQINGLRRKCFEQGIPVQTVKNKLIIKALAEIGGDYSELYPALKQSSSLLFAKEENASGPAKLLKEFRRASDKPALKAACIDTAVFLGDSQLDTLTKLKTKGQLIGEIVGLLQSPAKNVVSSLQSGGAKLAGILQTLSEKPE